MRKTPTDRSSHDEVSRNASFLPHTEAARPSSEEKYLRIVSGKENGPLATLARMGLWALTPLYGLIIAGYRGLYDAELFECKEVWLSRPVISIGNLTLGGTGKTGLALTLARLLQEEGIRPALLNYGYKAGVGRGPAIVSDGERVMLTPREAGDEAVMLAESLPGVPVIIGKRRIESGPLALESFRPDVLIMDDGFQYWRLARDINIVLLNAAQPWGYNALFPRGLLREMPTALRRATAVVLTHASAVPSEQVERLKRDVAKLAPQIPVFCADYAPRRLRSLEGETLALDTMQGARVGALSALGSPADFERSLKEQGTGEVVPYRFPDHHTYRAEEIEKTAADAGKRGLDMIVTTAKDAVKLKPLNINGLQPPIYVLESDMKVEPEAVFRDWLFAELERAENRRADGSLPIREGGK